MSFYEMIHSWGRVCLQCGSFRARPSHFCLTCEAKMLKHHQTKKIWLFHRGSLIKGMAYFTWVPNKNRPLSLLIENLKGEKMKSAWRFWAEQVLIQLSTDFSTTTEKRPILIPAPSSHDRRDHAFVFTQCLSELTGWKMKSVLHKMSAQSQKGLHKAQRKLIQVKADEKFSDEQPIIFVDDVITTGATAKAAYLALGRPRKFFVLSLAYRE